MSAGTTEFQGWKIVAVAFAAQGLAIGLTIIPYGLFINEIVAEFDTSVMTANLGITLLVIVMTAVGPVLGPILDRYSIRLVMVTGALIMSASFVVMSFASSLLVLAIALSTGVALGIAMLGPLASTTVVAKWFESKRGRAVGLAAMGPPAGGFLITPLAGNMIASFGWRTTLLCFAAIVLLIVPFIWTIVRNKPDDLGQRPDGEQVHPDMDIEDVEDEGWSTKMILTTSNFWVLALCFGIVFGIGGGWNANFPIFMGDLGYTVEQASYFMALGAFMGIPGTLLFGYLADNMDNRLVCWSIILIQGSCFAVLWLSPVFVGLLLVMAVFGMSGGGLLPVYAALIGRVFGPMNFGQVMGLAGLVMLPFGALAPPVAGYLRDIGGDYGLSLLIFTGCFGVSAVILWALKVKHPGALSETEGDKK